MTNTFYQIHRVQLVHQNGDVHYVTFTTDEIVISLEQYRELVKRKYHAQKVNLTYSEIKKD